mmetsp:Transcript_64290/g.151018  ORF Transcript_64290/g.151018 Transcript_64290/m.151018 type:complete len:200 (-) Transcript_64290:671-1270(-)
MPTVALAVLPFWLPPFVTITGPPLLSLPASVPLPDACPVASPVKTPLTRSCSLPPAPSSRRSPIPFAALVLWSLPFEGSGKTLCKLAVCWLGGVRSATGLALPELQRFLKFVRIGGLAEPSASGICGVVELATLSSLRTLAACDGSAWPHVAAACLPPSIASAVSTASGEFDGTAQPGSLFFSHRQTEVPANAAECIPS